jgi:hypothetical protein
VHISFMNPSEQKNMPMIFWIIWKN